MSCGQDNGPGSRKDIFSGRYYDLIKAISNNDTVQIEYLIDKYKLNVNQKDDDSIGTTLLRWSIYNNKKLSFKKLLDLGANPNFLDSIVTFPVISIAAENPDTDYLQYCLDHKGDPNIISYHDKNGSQFFSPLDAAAASGNFADEKKLVDNIKLLIKYGARVNYSQNYYMPLTDALIMRYYQKALVLLENGADPYKVKFVRIDNPDTVGICQILTESDKYPNDEEINRSKGFVIKYLKEHYNLECSSFRISK